jgi:biopolymer transport protein ExbD
MYRTIVFAGLMLGFLIGGCGSADQDNPTNKPIVKTEELPVDTNVIKVFVDATGKITADGDLISLADLDSSFSRLAKKEGTVYYSRSDVQGDPPQNAMAVMDLVAKHSLPVRFYTDITFTEAVRME